MAETSSIEHQRRARKRNELRAKQVRQEVKKALAFLKSKGIEDWEILNAWSEIAYDNGKYVEAGTLATLAIELGKPKE